jgi:hypothetical protein
MRYLIRVIFFISFAFLLSCAKFIGFGPGETPQNGSRLAPKVFAFYYPWYGTPQISGKWYHWNWDKGGTEPLKKDGRGLPIIHATNHPAMGLYDSNNPEVIAAHLALAKHMGIDAFISSWEGQNHFTDRALEIMMDQIEKLKYPIYVCIYYERVPRSDPEAAIEDFLYILKKYGKRPSYFKLNGKPVIFVFHRAMTQLSPWQWKNVIKKVKEIEDFVIIGADATHRVQGLDGVHFYSPVGVITHNINIQKLYASFVNVGRQLGKITALPVMPGYDDSHIGRESPKIISRENGALYKKLWKAAGKANPDWVLITSFNEWHEGTEIEPSIEYGEKFVELTAKFTREFKKEKVYASGK